jgi:HNH endonuclease
MALAPIPKVCEICNANFEVIRCRDKTARFCSKKCKGIHSIGHKPYHFKGGRMVHKGYVYILQKGHPTADRDGYVPEHRLVMEKHLGRFLLPGEVVHHKNRKRGDNKLSNLEHFSSHSEHMQSHYPKGRTFRDGCA